MLRNFSSLLTNKNRQIILHNRNFTSLEVSTALRPFYFAVHPDLFGKYPRERARNESSLQQLSSILEKIQKSKFVPPMSLSFYVKDKAKKTDKFRFINIHIQGNDIRTTLCTILKSCDLPTDYVDSIIPLPSTDKSNTNFKFKYKNEVDFTKVNQNHPIYAHIKMQMDMKRAQELLRLRNYLQKNAAEALKKSRKGDIHREEVKRLQEIITNELQVEDLRWDCSWNEEHRKGCLLSFMSLVNQHPRIKNVLRGRVLIFSSFFTGVSLDGHIMLYSGEVRNNWLDFLKNIDRYDEALKRIPAFENSLSHVLRKIKIGRSNKYLERALNKKCIEDLQLAVLSKDDNITPDLMIKCCEQLINNKYELQSYTKNLRLNITTYYSVLSDGVVCIPWNFDL
ncbi:T-cell activation inhibitor, mitochondrial isoform X2 [Diabrotica undecimpunctata]|uniref:T-cell activation inhibitor, mitochondrial isoform X2 n=1 Tax=Diabrotica undecimpunctata TaxID=50387 RepID=UPI003B63BD3E